MPSHMLNHHPAPASARAEVEAEAGHRLLSSRIALHPRPRHPALVAAMAGRHQLLVVRVCPLSFLSQYRYQIDQLY